MKVWGYCAGVLLLSLPAGQCQFLGPPSGATGSVSGVAGEKQLQMLLHSQRPPLRLRRDDVFSVQVYGVKDYDVRERIADDGTVFLPFVGKVEAAGQTVQELELSLQDLLAKNGIVKDPQVTIVVISQPWAVVTVSGDVAKPGTFPAYGDLTLMDYLSEAGGLNVNGVMNTSSSSPASSVVTLIRGTLPEPISIDLGSDAKASPFGRIPLFPGDEVRVGRAGVVYAVGAFKNEGAYPLKTSAPMTVLQLVAVAGGIGYQADRRDARVIREANGRRFELGIDVAKILQGRMADVTLEANDILFVPTSSMRAAIKGGGSGILVSLAAAYIYAHP